jgi:hypothetical protein
VQFCGGTLREVSRYHGQEGDEARLLHGYRSRSVLTPDGFYEPVEPRELP